MCVCVCYCVHFNVHQGGRGGSSEGRVRSEGGIGEGKVRGQRRGGGMRKEGKKGRQEKVPEH